ncbi:MAG: hypothetical protein Q9218_006407 [Villophora microphyllina]
MVALFHQIATAPAQGAPMALCENEPYTHIVAGTMTPAEGVTTQPPPPPSSASIILCAPQSRIYIALTPGVPVETRLIRPVVESSYQRVLHILAPPGKNRIVSTHDGWIFNTTIGAHELLVKNAGVDVVPLWIPEGLVGQVKKNRYVSFGELRDALVALYEHMNWAGWTMARFEIWDAGKEVGYGELVGV